MNQFLNYKRWKESKQYRMANWPRNVPEGPHDVQGQYINYFYEDPEHFRTRHGRNVISATPSLELGDYDNANARVHIHGRPSKIQYSGNTPEISLTVKPGLVAPTFKLLHHLVNSHNAVLPEGHNTSSIQHNKPGSEKTFPSVVETKLQDPFDFEDLTTDADLHKAQERYPESRVHGDINTPEDLAKHLSEAFGNLFLHHLNHRTGTIRHPGMDYATDVAEYKAGEETPDIAARKAIKEDHFMSGEHRANDALTKLHKGILKEYLTHHLQYPDSNMSYASFLASHKKHPEVATSLIRDILGGKFRRG